MPQSGESVCHRTPEAVGRGVDGRGWSTLRGRGGLDEQGGEAGVRRLLDETVDRVGRDQRGLSHPEPGVAITGGPEARAQQTDSEPGYEEHNTRRLRAHDSSVRTGREGHCTITS